MKIYGQLEENDCGIAVTQSLIEHFHGRTVDRGELYSRSRMGEEGMSIMDLENLNAEYGIVLESYAMDFGEFRGHRTKDYFILMINKKNRRHFTIARKDRRGVVLYDPAEGRVRVSYDRLEAIYENTGWRPYTRTYSLQSPPEKSTGIGGERKKRGGSMTLRRWPFCCC